MMTWRLKAFMSLACLAWASIHASHAFASTVSVLAPRTDGGYEEIIDALRQELNRSPGWKFHTAITPNTATAPLHNLPDDTAIVITVGLQAAQYAITNADPRIPVLSVLLPRASFETLAINKPSIRKISAVFIDQPPLRQLELLRTVLPAAREIGIVVGPSNGKDIETLRTLAGSRGLTLIAEQAAREAELYPVLQSVLRASDVLLALPDPYIINVSTAQNLLLTSFRFRVPVIGHSAAYVRAGALAAVYSTPRQIGLESAQLVRQFLKTGVLPQPKYPRFFTVSINRQMADSLGYTIADDAVVTQRIQQIESQE